MVVARGKAFTIASGPAFGWTEHGYEPPIELPAADGMLTPPSTLAALAAGYRPVLHPAIENVGNGQPG